MPKTPKSSVGASTGTDPYDMYVNTLKWIIETESKIPNVSQEMRDKSFKVDPLLRGSITEFLKNYILAGGRIVTVDNKKYEDEIKTMEARLEQLDPIGVFREDFEDFFIKRGHVYRRLDRDIKGKIVNLARLKGKITPYKDPWDSRVKAYHQSILVRNGWNTIDIPIEYNCWWIPNIDPGKEWVEGVDTEDPVGVKAAFDVLRTNRGITDITNLRIGSAEDIMAMHRFSEDDDAAPIDGIILAIWLKRLILVQSPNIIFRVLSPIIHLKRGLVYKETTDQGTERILTTVPQQPAAELATINPELYAQMSSEYSSYNTALKKDTDTIISILKNGGVYGSGPVDEINVVESGRNLTHSFMKALIDMLDEEIGKGIGFPVALLTATGSELATSRVLESILQKNLAGVRRQYEKKVEWILRDLFKDEMPLDEMQLKYVLNTPDLKDVLAEAQTKNTDADTLNKLKQFGMSRKDAQAVADELMHIKNLELSNYDAQLPGQYPQMQSSAPDDFDPADETGEDLSTLLKKDYKKAMASLFKVIDQEVES
jgi:hypothetical protein